MIYLNNKNYKLFINLINYILNILLSLIIQYFIQLLLDHHETDNKISY